MRPDLDMDDARRVIAAALAEDTGADKGGPGEDITSASVIPADLRFTGVMAARHSMVVAGMPVAAEVFRMVVPDARFTPRVEDGQRVETGCVLAEMEGPARGLLTAERTALNLLQLLSGIATLTRSYVERIEGTGCTLLDTRKTIPGLRRLSKYATRCGGASNHRMGLYDGVLIKDNHIAVCGGVGAAVRMAKAAGRPNIEAECDTLDQVAEAVAAGADIVLLDNMPPDTLRQAVAMVAGRCKTEASGGVTLDTIRAIAETGVDFVSVGRITQSAPAVDIGLDWN
ncbi:nicotinate-nucleotide diphosphorylase (carboxylating) [Paramagnetospirillum marisnigri]|uniref:Probable nicotinate-nucleotide pyrophosphorylase [carboxylating] n=1 Tax=Paramagnetospirillum marisnigri TaxID=1285242 RepID=A0A178MC38_9PROT|nr:carboxylating nicotinate-nucleotide diphosphorylase [Paramagnetospirillum marisnigri]OAN45615.1 nicotinate-nucleotide diphosphorylase (carboxylating) [Paramagnetospirillum marisnigri]